MKKGEFEPLEIPEVPSAVADLQLRAVFGHFLGQAVSLATEAQDGNWCPSTVIKRRMQSI